MRAATMAAGLALALDLGATPVAAGPAPPPGPPVGGRGPPGARDGGAGGVLGWVALRFGGVADRPRPPAAPALRGVRRGHRPEWRREPHHGWGGARAVRRGQRGGGRAFLHRGDIVAEPGAARDPGRPRPSGAVRPGPGPGPRRAGCDAMAPHRAEVRATPHPAVIVL